MSVDLLLKNGTIVTPSKSFRGNIAVKDGRIAGIGGEEFSVEADEVADLGGKHILPGVIDPHVHIGWPSWDWEEDCICTTRTAAVGGVTTVIHFLNEPLPLHEELSIGIERFERNAYVDGSFHEGIFTQGQIDEIPDMVETRGVNTFKFYLPYKGAEAVPPLVGIDDGIIYAGFKEIGKLKERARALIHAENIEIFYKIKEQMQASGEDASAYWTDTRPNWVEVESIRKVVAFAKGTGCPLYLVHLTTKEAKEEILRARAEGVDVIGETCPQYLVLNVENTDRVKSKVNPPLRHKEDNEAMWQAIQEGVITCIGTDHASVALKDKQDFWDGIVGFAGLETTLPVLLSEGVNKGRISIEKVAEITSYNVAKTFGLYPQKGSIEVGADADFAVVDLEMEMAYSVRESPNITDYSPYDGMVFKGWPIQTYLRGRLIFDHGTILGEKGAGKFIPRFSAQK